MNILLLNWRDPKNPKSGGAELVTMQHAKAWVAHGHSVVWLTTMYKGASSAEIIDGVTILRKGNILTVFLHALFFYLFSGARFDVVIDEIHGIPFFTPLYVRKPKITFIHEVANEIWDYMYPFPINVIGKFLETFYLPLYKNIPLWTDAPSTIEELLRFGFAKNNCHAIYCPAENSVIKQLPKKEKYNTYIFVSRVVKMKGIEEVIKSFAFISREDSDAVLWIVGKGGKDYVDLLKTMVVEYGIAKRVVFWGGVSEKEKLSLMAKAHVLLHASVKEGWGLVVIEAASQATPSVVYNVPGLRDSVKNNKTGIVLSVNSPQEMARQAILLVEDKKRYAVLQKNGLAWAKSLTWELSTKESLQLLERVKNGKIS